MFLRGFALESPMVFAAKELWTATRVEHLSGTHRHLFRSERFGYLTDLRGLQLGNPPRKEICASKLQSSNSCTRSS